MTEGHRIELRHWLAGRLKRDDVPPPLWAWMEDDGLVDGALDPGCPVSIDDLFSAARDRLRLAGELAPFVDGTVPANRHYRRESVNSNQTSLTAADPPTGYVIDHRGSATDTTEVPDTSASLSKYYFINHVLQQEEWPRDVTMDDPLLQRALAFSLYLAKLADEDTEVQNIRREVWNKDRPLYISEADELIHSHAAAVLPLDSFQYHGISVVRHRSRMVSQTVTRDALQRWASGVVVVVDGRDTDGRKTSQGLRVGFEGRALISSPIDLGVVESQSPGVEALGSQPVRILQGSVTSTLLDVADDLERRFPWRTPESGPLSTLNFILTGNPPLVEPIRCDVPTDHYEALKPMSISVWPWVSTAELASHYGRVRKELDPTPTTTNRRLTLLNFILGRQDVRIYEEGELPQTPPWRELCDSWNKRFPEGHDWHYTDVRNFNRDFRHAYSQTVRYFRSSK